MNNRYLDALRRADEETDGYLTMATYNSLERTPCARAIAQNFDGWNDAKRKAGIEVRETRGGQGKVYDREDCREALREVNSRSGRLMTHVNYEFLRDDDHPSAATIMDRWDGSFVAAREDALEEGEIEA